MKKKTVKKMSLKEKKAILDKLIAIEEEQEKIEQAEAALEQRVKKLNNRRCILIDQLNSGMIQNKESTDYPIIYKGKSFEISLFSVSIRDVKKI